MPDLLPLQTQTATQPSEIFDPWGGKPVTSWRDLNERLDLILEKHGKNDLVWRGVTDARWGLHSSLYRRLRKVSAAVTEVMMVQRELAILQAARQRWRRDDLSALELFAHIQHYGGPTRLLDITANPLIAAWFATEQKFDAAGKASPDVDCRVFCFYVGEVVELDSEWGGRTLPWENWHLTELRSLNDWGTGRRLRVWWPPAYNTRISAQNGGFLLDGVPADDGKGRFPKSPSTTYPKWTMDEIRDVSSIPLRLNNAQRAARGATSRPAFTFRIAAEARSEIRDRLEKNYGYSTSSIYSDLYGLAQFVAADLPQ